MLFKNILFKGAPLNECHQGKVVVVKHIFMRIVIKLGLFVCRESYLAHLQFQGSSNIHRLSSFFCLFVNLF